MPTIIAHVHRRMLTRIMRQTHFVEERILPAQPFFQYSAR